MKLSTALAKITGTAAEKTAAVAAPTTPAAGSTAPSNDIADRLKVALKEATAPEPTKTASAPSPVEDLTKIAADMARTEHEALVKEGQLYGAAICDGFMARAAQYNKAAADQAPPTIETKTAGEAGFEKFAAENPEMVKEAAQLGFDTTMGQLEKLGEAAYAKGWNDTVQQIHKTASDSFVAGFKAIVDIIEAAR